MLTAYYYTGDIEISKDTVQDIFEKLLQLPIKKRIEYFGGASINFEGYLTIVVKNKCLDIIKIKKNRERILQSIRPLFANHSENKSLQAFSRFFVNLI